MLNNIMCFNQTILKAFLVLSLLFFNSVCAAKTENEKPCKDSFKSFQNLPDEVLVGTDIFQLTTFKASQQSLQKKYVAEMGGAILEIRITTSANKKMVTRIFQEPDEAENIRKFSPLCQKNEFIRAGNMYGKLVEAGILILEKNSEHSTIPDDLWIYYQITN